MMMLLEICSVGSRMCWPSSQVSHITWGLARVFHWPPSQVFSFPDLYCGVTLPLSQWPLLANSPSSILNYLSSTTWEHRGMSQSLLWQLGEREIPEPTSCLSSLWLCFSALFWCGFLQLLLGRGWGEVRGWYVCRGWGVLLEGSHFAQSQQEEE